jgi:hypothetical protein
MKITATLLALGLVVSAAAQDVGKFYRLDFVVKELDDNKVVSAKTYSTFATTDEKTGATVRAGTRVPYQIDKPGAGSSVNYIDVGVNIDCPKLVEVDGRLVVHVTAEVSSVPAGDTAAMTLPVVRQNRWKSVSVIPVAKPVTLFSSDDLNSKRKLQLELTATPMK